MSIFQMLLFHNNEIILNIGDSLENNYIYNFEYLNVGKEITSCHEIPKR